MMLTTILVTVTMILPAAPGPRTGLAEPGESQPADATGGAAVPDATPAVRGVVPDPDAETSPAPSDRPHHGGSRDAMAIWLVNLARHQGHLVGRADPRGAALHVLALLEAAKALSPDCAEAHYWLYDVQQRLGRTDEASAALSEYVRLVPSDRAARLRYLETELGNLQSAEARITYIRSELERGSLPSVYESELRRRLARYHYERRETEPAAREAEHALRLNPMNIAARRLGYELFGETEPSLQRVETALQLIAMNPSQVNLIWDLGEFLSGLSLHREAQEWYRRAIDIHRRSASGRTPAEFWHQLALSYISSKDYVKAVEAAGEALKSDPSLLSARLLRAHAQTKLGRFEAAEADIDSVSQAYASRAEEIVEKRLTGEAAEAAWFYCYHQPERHQALRLAEVAISAPEPGSLARLAHGYALRLNGRTVEAMTVLEPLSSIDQLAGLELAKCQIDRGNRAQAVTTLHKAATLRYSGIAYELIRGLLTKYGENAPQAPLQTKVLATLRGFPRDVFDFHHRPGDFLKFTLRFAEDPLPATGPLDVVFRLENIGPFPIPLGEGFMCRPLIAVTARLHQPGGPDATKDTIYENYLQVMMHARPVLFPGRSMEKTVAIDVGPFREALIRTVTRSLSVEVNAMLDPVYHEGELTAGLGTLTAAAPRVMRNGIDVSRQGMATFLDLANSPEPEDRMTAVEILSALLAEAEGPGGGSLASNLPLDAIREALAALVCDPDWRVRARGMVAVGWSRLDSRVTVAAAPGVRQAEDPIVKLLAVRLFAEQHGDRFVQVLEQLSKTDPNRFVRVMAESYLPQRPRVQANQTVSQTAEPLP